MLTHYGIWNICYGPLYKKKEKKSSILKDRNRGITNQSLDNKKD